MNEIFDRISNLTPEKKKLLLDKIKINSASHEQTIKSVERVYDTSGKVELPMSFSQLRMWFLYQWEKDSSSYNIPFVFSLKFKVDLDLLDKSINMLIERHEILRTTYKNVEEDTVQVIHPFKPSKLEIIDLRNELVSAAKLKAAIVKEKVIIPFDIENEFPIRAYLYTLNEEEHYLLLNIHHIACDGWSLNIIINELRNNYTFLVNHKQPDRSPPAIQYADFASWQRQNENSATFDKHQLYWKSVFDGDVPVLEMPTDRPRPPIKTYNGYAVIKHLPSDLYKEINQLCIEEDATLYMVTLTAYAVLLYKYTGQTDIVIGSPIANRTRTEIEDVIGLFVNTLPLRIKINEKATFIELVRQVKKISFEAYDHQDYPLEKIIEMLSIERDMSHSPLFQVMYVMQNMLIAHDAKESADISFECSINTDSSKFDLTLSSTNDFIQAEYNTDIFDQHTMEKLLEHYINILVSVNKDSNQVISDINLLSNAEKQEILTDWNNTEAAYDDGFHVVSCIESQSAKNSDKIALVYEGTSYTYDEMNTYANKLANYLITHGVGPEKIVGIFIERSADFVMAMLAVLKAGAAYVPIDPSYPEDRIQHMVKESGAQIVITQNKFSSEANFDNVTIVNIDADEQQIRAQKSENPAMQSSLDNLMYIIFTSGSTGMPKGIAVELRNFQNYIQGIIKHLKITKPQNYAVISTLAADLGLTNVFGALCTGGTLHVLSYDRSCDPDAVSEYFRDNKIDIMKAVPSHFEVLMTAENPEYIVPHNTLILAGEGLSWETVRKIKALNPDCVIENHYGPTETTVSAMAYPIPNDLNSHSSNIVPIGRPIGNVKTYVLDSYLNPVPAGIPGELYIGGEGVSRGYVNNPELTNSSFIPNPFSEVKGDRLYKTGDKVKYLYNGTVDILGRMDRQVKIRGYRIELGEIESAITSIPYVKDSVVQVKEVSKTDKRIVSYIVFEKDFLMEDPFTDLRKKLNKILPDYMIPNHMLEMDSLPLNANGKVDVYKLPPIDIAKKSSNSTGEQPQTENEKMIHEVWKDVLGIDDIGIDDNFFELGGESFKALKIVRRISDWIGVMDFFKNPTIRELAQFIDEGKTSEVKLLHKLKKSSVSAEDSISLICVPYAGGSAIIYQPLAKQVPSNYELYSTEIPGHDYNRKGELLSLQETARLCVEEIKETVKGPIVLYGHCVGGALTLEIARQLEEENLPLLRVFVGGALPIAHIPGKIFSLLSKLFPTDRQMSNKSYHEFLKALGGFNDVEDTKERDFLIRNLRHDARESEAYFSAAYSNKEHVKLRAPITCIVGERDRATELYGERYLEWGYFSSHVDLKVIPMSGHYFIKFQVDQLVKIIFDALQPQNMEAQNKDIVEEQKSDTKIKAASTIQNKSTVSLRNKDIKPNLRTFFIVVFSQLVSVLGSSLTSIAVGVWVFAQTGAVSDFAAISSASLVPGILALPIAGAIVDRYDRRLVMLFSDILAALSVAVLVILAGTNSLEVWHIYISSAVTSITRSFHRPAFTAAVSQIIPKQYLGHANGIVQFASSTSEMIAPLIGVSLYAFVGIRNLFITNFICLSVAITTLLLVRFPNTLFRKREEAFIKEVLMGWKFIIKRPSMIYLIIFFFVSNTLFGIITVLFQPLVLSFGTAAQFATVSLLGALGGMAGALLMSLWGGTKRRATGMVGFVILEGFCVIFGGFHPSFIFPAIGIFGFWLSVTLVNSHWQALIQSKVGLELQGRVLATNQMFATSSMPIGYMIAGFLANPVFEKGMLDGGGLAKIFGSIIGTGTGRGIGLMLICAGILAAIWGTIGLRFKPLRYMEDTMEDAIPDAVIEDRDLLQEKMDSQIINS